MAEASAAHIRAVLVAGRSSACSARKSRLPTWCLRHFGERRSTWRALVAAYEPLAAISRYGEMHEDGTDAEDPVRLPPRGLRLPLSISSSSSPTPRRSGGCASGWSWLTLASGGTPRSSWASAVRWPMPIPS